MSREQSLSEYHYGYSNEKLIQKASREGVEVGLSPWVYWTSELYSVGRLYREQAWFPKAFPLYFYSDHGIHPTSELQKHELENDSHVHFTFNQAREERYQNSEKKVYLVRHPWVNYRRRKTYQPAINAKGTLVFLSHSTTNVEWVEKDRDGYFRELENLPDECKPLVLCMHMHDINKKNHLHYRKYGLPIITCGNTSSINFVDEFYRIATQFKYGTSNAAGSQMYYCVEMGMPYFLLGETPILLNKTDLNLPTGEYKKKNEVAIKIHQTEQKLFRGFSQKVTEDQKRFAQEILGFGSTMTRFKMACIIWGQFIKNITSFTKLVGVFVSRKLYRDKG